MKCVLKEFYLALGASFEQVKGKCTIAKIISSKVNGLDGNLQYSKKKAQVDKIYCYRSIIVSRDEEELEKSSFGRTSKEKSLGTRLEYRLL